IHGLHYINSSNLLRKSLSRTIEQYLVQFTDVTICETYNDYLLAVRNRIAGRANTQVIPNAIDVSRFSNLKRNYQLMQSIGLSKDDFICGNISRFDEQKNQKMILQAAYFLVKKFPNMKFVFVGDGKYLHQMRDLARESNIENNIIFAGEQKNLPDFYSIFDIFLFPTLWEGMPFVLLEAMASRLPIICSAIPNLLEVIKPNYSALTIDPLDMDDLFQKVSSLYQDANMRDKIAQNAMIESTQYDESEIIPRIAAIYEEVIQR
ncbi:MAG: glycosyltransferase, partial [Ignavibacteria bacterium]|nr:glycosyltransferase [Ignavibacteria bacterium]